MASAKELTHEEQAIAIRVNQYFSCTEMNFRDKLQQAVLIAQHELDSHNFCSEAEKARITKFMDVIHSLLQKFAE